MATPAAAAATSVVRAREGGDASGPENDWGGCVLLDDPTLDDLDIDLCFSVEGANGVADAATAQTMFECTVRSWYSASGFGYLTCDRFPSEDIFVSGAVNNITDLAPGDTVTCSLERNAGGVQLAMSAVRVVRVASPSTSAASTADIARPASGPTALPLHVAGQAMAQVGAREQMPKRRMTLAGQPKSLPAKGAAGAVGPVSKKLASRPAKGSAGAAGPVSKKKPVHFVADPAELALLVGKTPASELVAHVAAHFERTSMERLAALPVFASTSDGSGPLAAMQHRVNERVATRRCFVDKLRTTTEAGVFVVWMFERIMRPTLAVSSAGDERKLHVAQSRAIAAYQSLLHDPETLARLQPVLVAMGLVDTPSIDMRLLLANVFQALCDFREKTLDARIACLPPFQPDFVPPPSSMDDVGLEKFAYIIGWIVFKLRGRVRGPTDTSEERPALRFVLGLIGEETVQYDAVTCQKLTHIVPNERAVRFGAVVERVVFHLLDNFIMQAGPAVVHYVKASALNNIVVQRMWGELTSSADLPAETSSVLLLLWLQYYMKSRQKEFIRSKGWQPRPQPSLRASLRSAAAAVPQAPPSKVEVAAGGTIAATSTTGKQGSARRAASAAAGKKRLDITGRPGPSIQSPPTAAVVRSPVRHSPRLRRNLFPAAPPSPV